MKWAKATSRTANNLQWSKAGITTPLKFAPGDGWWYGTALDWAGLVLEKLAGQTLGAYMQEHVFKPLGMRDTGFWPEKLPQTAGRSVASSFREGEGLKSGPPTAPAEHEMESGGAGLFTTASDYSVFMTGLLQGKLVGEGTLAQMFTPQLNEAQSKMLEIISYHSCIQPAIAPEFPKGLALNFGIGGVMNTEDVPGKRRRASLMWSGMCNSRWVSAVSVALCV